MGHLIDQGKQSATIKSYVSTIEKMLLMDGYDWNENLVLVRSLAKACKIINKSHHQITYSLWLIGNHPV